MPKTILFEDSGTNESVSSEATREELVNEVLANAADSKLLSHLTTGLQDALEAQSGKMIMVLDNLLFRLAEWTLCSFGESPNEAKFTQATLVSSTPDSFIEIRVDGVAPTGGRKGVSEHWYKIITDDWCREICDLRLIIRNLKAAGIIKEIPSISTRFAAAKKAAAERKEFAKSREAARDEAMKAKTLEVLDEDGI